MRANVVYGLHFAEPVCREKDAAMILLNENEGEWVAPSVWSARLTPVCQVPVMLNPGRYSYKCPDSLVMLPMQGNLPRDHKPRIRRES